ncbi:hypothetical protein GN958_ATG15228 [Phytophthora infestans]|uniref:Cyclic nucleotide-binding domain-containing protein n=1 Tax=Phytophthora infestans TaxID=4787 RepID=A0A8S9U8F9_PHYIN|nr:hypothetical protein GN958_ATG15228 [Phytophthora infestans]
MFFLLEGQVYMVEKGDSSREIPRGSFFGTAVLTQLERGEGYTEHVSANSGCILLLVSRDQLQAMELIFPTLKEEFLALEQRLQGNKLATTRVIKSTVTVISSRILQNLVSTVKESVVSVHDPDSPFVLAWETWVFAVMTLQWALVMLQACYPMESKHKVADALMIFLELSFVLDIQIRSRLGYYEFGNKIMDPVRIKRKYLRSGTLMLDILALIRFLSIPTWLYRLQDKRWDLLESVNKLLRLFKVETIPRSGNEISETRPNCDYFSCCTTHIHAVALFGLAIWFNFASGRLFSFASVEARTPALGNRIPPPEQLEHGSHVLRRRCTGRSGAHVGVQRARVPEIHGPVFIQCFITMTTGFSRR